MSAHDRPRHVCPYCLKWFETKQGVKAHQKSTRHTTMRQEDGAAEAQALRHYDHVRRAQIKAERRNSIAGELG